MKLLNLQLTEKRVQSLAEISRNIAQVFFAAIVVEPLINRSVNTFLFIFGFILAAAFWILSLIFEE